MKFCVVSYPPVFLHPTWICTLWGRGPLRRARARAALGYFIAAVSPNMDIANAALPAYVTVLLFFVGLLLRPQDQPSYWHWFSYLDFLKYAWAAQMINQFEHSHAVALDFQTVRARGRPGLRRVACWTTRTLTLTSCWIARCQRPAVCKV